MNVEESPDESQFDKYTPLRDQKQNIQATSHIPIFPHIIFNSSETMSDLTGVSLKGKTAIVTGSSRYFQIHFPIYHYHLANEYPAELVPVSLFCLPSEVPML